MTEKTRHGYLFLADISGYTSFLAQVELEHAQEILTDLLEVIVEKFQSLLTISQLEGDAVFAYVDEAGILRGEALLELIESTYVAFCQRRDTSTRATNCTCKACQSMPSLELKFFAHHGNFMTQHVAGSKELVGSDVNLVHRLMKNHVTEKTGWYAYALFTKVALESMKLKLEDVHNQVETYEHLGEIETISINLIPRYDAIVTSRNFYISSADSDFSISREFSLSQPDLWQLLTSPEIFTSIWQNNLTWIALNRPGGRSGVGAVNHCVHGKKSLAYYTIVDWQPFDYFSSHVAGYFKSYEMYEINPATDKSRAVVTFRWQYDSGLPRWIGQLVGRFLAKRGISLFFNNLERYIVDN